MPTPPQPAADPAANLRAALRAYRTAQLAFGNAERAAESAWSAWAAVQPPGESTHVVLLDGVLFTPHGGGWSRFSEKFSMMFCAASLDEAQS